MNRIGTRVMLAAAVAGLALSAASMQAHSAAPTFSPVSPRPKSKNQHKAERRAAKRKGKR